MAKDEGLILNSWGGAGEGGRVMGSFVVDGVVHRTDHKLVTVRDVVAKMATCTYRLFLRQPGGRFADEHIAHGSSRRFRADSAPTFYTTPPATF